MKPFLYALGAAALAVGLVLGLGAVVDRGHQKLPVVVQGPTK